MKRKILTALGVVAVVPLIAVVALGVFLKNTATEFDQKLSENSVDALTPSLVEPIAPRVTEKENSETILLLGTDYRKGEGARSDTMMLLNIDSTGKNITGVSIPRDLVVEQLPSCELWDSSTGKMLGETTEFYPYTMANQAYSVGGGACAVRMAEHISGLKVDRFVEISFQGFENVVDALGGVTLNICAPMNDENLGEIFPEAGTYHVDGKTALDFVRARKVYGDTGSDTSRMERQQYLLEQIKNESLNLNTLLTSTASKDALMAVAENTRTDNMNSSDFMHLAASLQGTQNTNLFTLPVGAWEYDPNRLIDDPATTEWLFSEIAAGNPVTKEQAQETYNTNMGLVSYAPTSQVTRTGEASTSQTCGWG